MKKFKILFVYPNTPLLNPPPVSIGIFSALLKPMGVEVQVFDTTFYVEKQSSDKAKEENLQVRPFSYDMSKLPISEKSPGEDLRAMIKDYSPDLVATSSLESTWFDTATLLDAAADILEDIPVLAGGIFPTFAPEIVIGHPQVDMVCIGEGEGPIVDLVERIRAGEGYSEIKNLWVKKLNGKIVKNPLRSVVPIENLPIPDYSAFHKARMLRPMAGQIYRTVPVETNRGCPYGCSFCNSPTTSKFYKDAGAGIFFRKKPLTQIQEELRHLITIWEAEYVYFLSDTFLALTNQEFDRFIDIYSEFNLPFWIQSRPETVTEYRAKKLKEVGCHRMSIGLEHGNERFRKTMLKKPYRNSQMIKAAHALAEAGIPLSVNNIIGFPEETRELIFDTIELNRQIPFDTVNAYAFTPFHGTPLHSYCVQKGWRKPEEVVGCLTMDSPLDMPQLTKKEIEGLRRTFALYAKMPKEYWPDIARAEVDDEEGNETFKKLREHYIENYF